MKKSRILFIISLVLCISLLSGNGFESIYAESTGTSSHQAIISDALIAALNSRSGDNINVVIWQDDIDHDAVLEQVENAVSAKRSSVSEISDMETVQEYISQKRYFAMKKYEELNQNLVTKVISEMDNTEIVFVSRFSPVVIASMPKANVYTASEAEEVTYMDLFVNAEIVPYSDVANVNNGTAQLRDTSSINATGKGVKIGQIEPGVLNENYDDEEGNYYFNSEKLHLIGDAPNITTYEDLLNEIHANLVAAIMVGQPITYVGVTYKGIAPDAELYYSSVSSELSLLIAVENLIAPENGVNIINMSAGVNKYGVYDFVDQWIDHLAFAHDVHFIKSAGNYDSEKNPENHITSPGTSYNSIVVGNVADNNTIIGNNAPASLSQQCLNSNFGVHYSSCYKTDSSYGGYKPDIVAWGTGIQYGDIFMYGADASYNTGTSFAAPQVTGIIAQLCETNPSLLTNNSKIKALLTATAVYRAPASTNDDYASSDSVYTDCCMTEKQGAGIVNALCAYRTVNAGKTKDVTMSGGTQYYTFTINVPSSYDYLRLSMAWIKKNSITGTHSSTSASITDKQLANLKLEIFYGTDTSGTPVAWSDSAGNNLELLQFNVEDYGTYTVRITNHDYNAGLGAQYISLAWY